MLRHAIARERDGEGRPLEDRRETDVVSGATHPQKDEPLSGARPHGRVSQPTPQHRDLLPTSVFTARLVAWLVTIDVVVAEVAALIGVLMRFGSDQQAAALRHLPYAELASALPAVWVAALLVAGAYDRRFLVTGPEEFQRVVNAGVWLLAAIALTSFFTHADLSRGLVAIVVPLVTLQTLAARYTARKVLHRMVTGGRHLHRVVVTGSADEVKDLISHMRRAPHAGYDVVGACVAGEATAVAVADVMVPVLGPPSTVCDAARLLAADTIAVAGTSALSNGELRRLSWKLEGTGTRLVVAPAITDIAGPRIRVRPVHGLPLLHVEEPEFSGMQRLLKDTLDRTMAAVLLVLLAPVLLGTALAIRLTSRGPALFCQLRLGRLGAQFIFWKFRTMRVGAEQEITSLLAVNEHDGVLFKIRADPRVTPLGRWLRRYSIDELPQLWNVLRGTMSIVGPRPSLSAEVERCEADVRRRLLVKPGMTGLWQISGRSDLTWEEAVRLDLYYVENWSIPMDLVIVWKTIAAVLSKRGAY
jgi:exopolysaccharide biosynthesis polyprenyl glycosylphosphotransferase